MDSLSLVKKSVQILMRADKFPDVHLAIESQLSTSHFFNVYILNVRKVS